MMNYSSDEPSVLADVIPPILPSDTNPLVFAFNLYLFAVFLRALEDVINDPAERRTDVRGRAARMSVQVHPTKARAGGCGSI